MLHVPSPSSKTYKAYNGLPVARQSVLDNLNHKLETGSFFQHDETSCAVAVTAGTYDHLAYARLLGVAPVVPYLVESVFEALPHTQAPAFAVAAAAALQPGADTALVADKFCLWLLTDPLPGLGRYMKTLPEFFAVHALAVDLFRQMLMGTPVLRHAWEQVRLDSLELVGIRHPVRGVEALNVISMVAAYNFTERLNHRHLKFALDIALREERLVDPLAASDTLLKLLQASPVRRPAPRGIPVTSLRPA